MEPNAILSESLSLSSDIPLYAQLVGIIKRSISSGALAIGDLLPSEAELCRALNVSRNTVRQAIGELEDEGLVVRKRGKGTFVADPNTNRRGVRYSFTTEVSSLGKTPSSTLVDFGVIVPTRAICEKMELREGTSVYCFTRVRNVDGEPLILETSYYPQFIYPNLTREMVQTHSFYSLLYHVGMQVLSLCFPDPCPGLRAYGCLDRNVCRLDCPWDHFYLAFPQPQMAGAQGNLKRRASYI